MSKGRTLGIDLVVSVGIGMGVYLLAQLLLALLVVKSVVPESGVLGIQVLVGGMGTLLGGLWAAKVLPWGPLPSGAAAALGTAAVTALLGMLLYDGVALTAETGLRLGVMLGGGLLAGGLRATGGGHRKRRRGAVRRK